MTQSYPKIQTVGLSGLLVTFSKSLSEEANIAALSFRMAADGQNWDWVSESSSTLVSCFFRVDLSVHNPDACIAALAALLETRDWAADGLPSGRTLWHIPAVFGGTLAPQLNLAAEAAGLDPTAAVTELTQTRLRVITIGFAPGQPYLGTLGAHWDIPRLPEITPNVPRGALVAAVKQICLFSNDTPTGWRHVGQCGFRTFRPQAEVPFPLSPGDEIQFHEISEAEYRRIMAHNADGAGGATQEVLL